MTATGDGKSRRRPTRATNSKDKDEPTSPSSPLAQFPPLPPAESRSRAPEFYGFVAWAVTCLLFVLYFLWAILPEEWIIWLGVTWYPNRCVLAFHKIPPFNPNPTTPFKTPRARRANLKGLFFLPLVEPRLAVGWPDCAMHMAQSQGPHPLSFSDF